MVCSHDALLSGWTALGRIFGFRIRLYALA
jgi:hypothetical protein